MTLLSRYLVRQNLFLLFAILLISTGLYLLTDFFERLDNFLESGLSARLILLYLGVKIPAIVSQVLPAVFMMSLVVQMNFLERSREMVALAAGGISPLSLVRFVLLYGIVWALAQFLFAQVLGVTGERVAGRIWQEDVRGNIFEQTKIHHLWFTEGRNIVHIGTAYPVQQRGSGIQVYILNEAGTEISEIVKANEFAVAQNNLWILTDGEYLVPDAYTSVPFEQYELALRQDMRAFQIGATTGGIKPNQLSLRELSGAIKRLEFAGSNVESLRTAWHSKLAYACSMVVMGILAFLISQLTPSIYKAVIVCLLIVFFYYGMNTICSSMGEKGLISPFISAWFANIFFFYSGMLSLLWPFLIKRFR